MPGKSRLFKRNGLWFCEMPLIFGHRVVCVGHSPAKAFQHARTAYLGIKQRGL